jgi:hypothetical protein
MLGTAAAVQTNLTELADDSVANRLTKSVQVSKETSNLQTKYLVEESVFHRFIKHGKGLLSLVGQRLRFVFAKYAEVPSALVKALDQLTDGRGLGYLAKIIFLFLLLIAIGFGVEKLFNVTIQKHIQQLQSTIPNSFFQLITRLSGRTVLELLSFAVFTLAIVVVYLLFYPTDSPLHQLAVVYLPPIFIIRLASIVLNAVYSPKTPHLRIVPQNCHAVGTYLKGFMAFIIISLFTSKTLILLKSHGLNEGVFLLLYAHLGVVQFIILLTILWKDRARIGRSVVKDQDAAESKSPSSEINLKRLWFPIACLGLLGFELLWQVNLIMYRRDLVLPLLLTVLSIPFGFLLTLFHRQSPASDSRRPDRTNGSPHRESGYSSQGCRYLRFCDRRTATGARLCRPGRWFLRAECVTFQSQPIVNSKNDGHSYRMRPVILGDGFVGPRPPAGPFDRPIGRQHLRHPVVGLCGLGDLSNNNRP